MPTRAEAGPGGAEDLLDFADKIDFLDFQTQGSQFDYENLELTQNSQSSWQHDKPNGHASQTLGQSQSQSQSQTIGASQSQSQGVEDLMPRGQEQVAFDDM